MASTYTANSGIEKIGSGEQSGTWGTTTNTNFDIIDRAINGVGSISLSGTTHTLTTTDGALSDGGYKVLSFTGALGANNTVTISPNDQDKVYFIYNGTTDSGSSGPYSVILTQGSGGNVTVPNGSFKIVYADGAGSGAKVTDVTSALDVSALRLGGTAITSTAAELNIMDGGTSAGTTAVAAGDGIVTNDGGTMRQTTAATFSTYFNQNLVEAKSPLTVSGTVTVTPSGATSVYQPLTVSSGSQTVRVAVTNLVAGQYVIIDKTTTANSMTIDWNNNSAVTSSGISLGSDAELGIGIFNGSSFSFTETVKF